MMLLENMVNQIKDIKDNSIAKALQRVCVMFACSNILDDDWNGIMPPDQFTLVKKVVLEVMEEIRPDVIALTDAFDLTDTALNSTIGRYDGNVYEALFESAKKATLNQVDPFVGYKEHLRPHLDLEFLQRKNKLPEDEQPKPKI